MDREKSILQLIKEKEYMLVEDIAKQMNISQSTVRRKLEILQSKGLVKRTHGGVKNIDSNNSVYNFSLRIHTNVAEKKKIALKAIKLIKDGDVIFLDGSTTTYFLAEYLNEFKGITVITNGIDTLSLLAKNGVEAISTGGKVSKQNTSVLIGNQATTFIRSVNANVCFFSCQSCSREGIISDCYQEENHIRKEMINNSEKTVFLCDKTKFEKKSSYNLCSIDDIDIVIADNDVENYFDKNYKNKLLI